MMETKTIKMTKAVTFKWDAQWMFTMVIKSLDYDLDIKDDNGSDYNDQDKNYQFISVAYCTKLYKDKCLIYVN